MPELTFVPPYSSWEESQQTLLNVGDKLQRQINSLEGMIRVLEVPVVVSTSTSQKKVLSGVGGGLSVGSSPFPVLPSALIIGTHADRVTHLPTTLGQLYYETDRGVKYYSNSGVWIYFSGYFNAPHTSLPTDLGANDAGFVFLDTTYIRSFTWDGSGWSRTYGEPPTREFIYVAEDPGTGWHVCDGSSGIVYTLGNATLGTMTMPNEVGAYRKGGASYTGTLVSASNPIFTGNALGNHSHTLTGGTPSTATGVVGTIPDATSANSGGTPSGTVGTEGEPLHLTLLPYMKL